jgi:hypothetical protein
MYHVSYIEWWSYMRDIYQVIAHITRISEHAGRWGEDYFKPDSLRFAIFTYKGYILRHVIAAFSVLYMLCITFIWFVLVSCLRGTSLKLHVSYLIFQNSSFNIGSIRRSLFHFIYFNVLLRPLTKNKTTLD